MGVAADGEGNQSAVARLLDELAALNADLGVPSPRGSGIDEGRYIDLIPTMAAQALASGSPANNPRVPSLDEIADLYRLAFGRGRAMSFRAMMRLLGPAVLTAVAVPASAASFDCAAASSPDERAVCASRALNDRDVTMSLLYGLDRKFLPMGGRGDLIDQQTAWLRERRACGDNHTCLARAYDRRIAVLQKVIDDRVVSRGPF